MAPARCGARARPVHPASARARSWTSRHDAGGELAAVVDAGCAPHDVAAALLRAAGARRPPVVVLEDLHWADEATLDVVRLLAPQRRPGAGARRSPRTATTSSSRRTRCGSSSASSPRAAPSSSWTWSRCRRRRRRARGPGRPRPDALHRQTSGNPFFVTEVLAAGGDASRATVRGGRARPRRPAEPRGARAARRRGDLAAARRGVAAGGARWRACRRARGVPGVRDARARAGRGRRSGTSSRALAIDEALEPGGGWRCTAAALAALAVAAGGPDVRAARPPRGGGRGRGAVLRYAPDGRRTAPRPARAPRGGRAVRARAALRRRRWTCGRGPTSCGATPTRAT